MANFDISELTHTKDQIVSMASEQITDVATSSSSEQNKLLCEHDWCVFLQLHIWDFNSNGM